MAMIKQKTSYRMLARQGSPAQRGVVLLEALVSILLFSMGVLALVGLQAAMIKNNSDSKYRAEASYIAQQWIGRMWADPTQPGAYIILDNNNTDYDISSLLPNGTRVVKQPDAVTYPNQFEIIITWQQPGQLQHNYTTVVNIAGG
jgi:type IV pilus assembly protein PilV